MPVQINEVIIKALIDPGTANGGTKTPAPASSNTVDYDAIEMIFELIKEKQER